MNRPQRHAWVFIYTALLASLGAMLLGFNGKVSLKVTPFNFTVEIDGAPATCLIDLPPKVDSQSQAKLPQQ